MKTAVIFLILSIIMFSCTASKKVQNIPPAPTKVDSPYRKPVEERSEAFQVKKSDTDDVYKKVVENKIDFATFNARVRLKYEGMEGGDNGTAYVRLKKDSIMWLSVRGALGIEGFRILITKDSVMVINFLKKNIQQRSIGFLQEVT